MEYILNPFTYSGLNWDPRERYVKLVAILIMNTTILQLLLTVLKYHYQAIWR
jgi:hypothetical protein